MWQPSGLIDVLIKCCCCNVSETWFDGVILVIAGNSEYVIVIYWSLFGSVKAWLCIGFLEICTITVHLQAKSPQTHFCDRQMFHPFDINETSIQF